VLDQIGAAVGAMLSLDANAIAQVQASPNALSIAIWILLLGTLSDVIGDSPLLFLKKMRPSRFAAAMAIETGLSIVRAAIWILSFWALIAIVTSSSVSVAEVLLVVGLGYAPMLFSFFVLLPYLGPLIGRLLHAWTLVAILASMAVASNASGWQLLAPGLVAVLLILVVRRWSNRVTVSVLGRISQRMLGADVMQRTRAMDPRLAMLGRSN
jgi:hypothetical protein